MPHCWQGSVANYCEDLYGFVLAAKDDAEIGEWDATGELASPSSGEKSSSITERLMTQPLMIWDATGMVR